MRTGDGARRQCWRQAQQRLRRASTRTWASGGRVNDDARSQAGLGSLLVTARCSEDYWTGTGEPVELGATRRRESRETTLSGSAGHELLCMT